LTNAKEFMACWVGFNWYFIVIIVRPKPNDQYFENADGDGVGPGLVHFRPPLLKEHQNDYCKYQNDIDHISDLLLRVINSDSEFTLSENDTFFDTGKPVTTVIPSKEDRPDRFGIVLQKGNKPKPEVSSSSSSVASTSSASASASTSSSATSSTSSSSSSSLSGSTPTPGVRPEYPTEDIPISSSIGSVEVQNHWSQSVTFPRPDQTNVLTENSMQVNCPYLEAGLVRWEDPSTWPNDVIPQANGEPFSLPADKSILVSAISLAKTGFYGYITVPATSRLIFSDEDIDLHTMGMDIAGVVSIGTAQCRMTKRIRILLYGSRTAQTNPGAPWVKGIHVAGVLDVHGQVYTPTWTRLANTAQKGDTVIYVQDRINWQVSQTIVITTTVLKDSLDYTQNEQRTISKVQNAPHLGPKISAITLNQGLDFSHYGYH
jgi:hypothetical protein